MSEQLKPMHWPLPVPMLWWVGDYADIRERIRRDGRIDRDEVWLPDSGDGWGAFCGRHGTYGFDWDWREFEQHDRAVATKAREREAKYVQRIQEAWEAQRRARQQAKQTVADREWLDVDEAKAYWSGIDAAYAMQQYHLVPVRNVVSAYGVTFEAGKTYWVPTAVMFTIRGHGG